MKIKRTQKIKEALKLLIVPLLDNNEANYIAIIFWIIVATTILEFLGIIEPVPA